LLRVHEHEALLAGRQAGAARIECSLDLGRSNSIVELHESAWTWNGQRFPFAEVCRPRTIYRWDGEGFAPVARFTNALIKLVPTDWGPPTFEIDGIKMLPTAQVSPYDDAARKVALIQPRGKRILDTCGGLGYFAAWCLRGGATQVISYEKNPDVIWLRQHNPWSPEHAEPPQAGDALVLTNADVGARVGMLADASVDAILHDPPRFGIAGELYSQAFYDQLARVLKPRGRMFHYTGTPNKLTSRRDVPAEVASRLQRAGFATEHNGDGVLAIKNAARHRAQR
jgi:predicted methyltransferase